LRDRNSLSNLSNDPSKYSRTSRH